MRKRVAIIVAVVGLLIIILTVLSVHHRQQAAAPQLGPPVSGCSSPVPDKAAVLAALRNQPANSSSLASYDIQAIKEPQTCWDVVTLTKSSQAEPQTVILQRVGSSIYVSAGPATSFPKSLMQQLDVPTGVQATVVVYDDTSSGGSEQGQ